MTNELDTLRPEIREAVAAIDGGNGVFVDSDDGIGGEKWRVVRAELLRLQSTESRANEWQLRAERAEVELAESRETIKRLNRRVQIAEAGVAERVKASGYGFGRSLANAAAKMFRRERDEAQAELAALKSQPSHGHAQDAINKFGVGGELSHEEMCEVVNQAVCAERELAALKARMKPCARVVGGEVHALMDPNDEGKYVAVLVVEE